MSPAGAEDVLRPARGPAPWFGLVTADPAMRALFAQVERVAPSQAAVLVRGETGTGKEHIARALHQLSARREGPFLAVNCATFTPELLASELFGHVRGAFTGAIRDRKGLFELADGGTLFLDEIAELPLGLQAQLLRVVQERSFVPVGGTEPIQVNVRLISATHRSLRHEVAAGRFRADLMYRVRVIPLFLPPLRARAADLAPLLWHFIERLEALYPRRIEAIDHATFALLSRYDWPGNVRELRNALEYAMATGEGPNLRASQLPPELRGEPPLDEASPSEVAPPVAPEEPAERARVLAALQAHRGHRGHTAKALGISRATLWRKLREYGVHTPR